jgi:endonuclease/exonuclease/phosphatase family metal-dependent hydrolase
MVQHPAAMGWGMVRLTSALALALALYPLTSCTGPSTPTSRSARPIELKVMTFNVLYGGSYGFQRVLRIIRRVEPDIVGLQEPYGKVDRIAGRLGWHGSPRLHVISRFPILETDSADWGYVEVAQGRVVAVANTHLPSVGYGPYAVREGAGADEVLEGEAKRRVPWTTDLLQALEPVVADRDMPVFLTGDFNSPSHRDWTAEVAAVREEVRYPVRWPVSLALEEAGFRDSYRQIHPDPVADPGFTWTPGSGFPPRIRDGEVFDRIDYVWSKGPAETEESRIVGEAGGPYTDVGFEPWPSDHRAVVSTFRATPAAPPTSVAVTDARVELGEPLEVRFFAAPGSDRQVVLRPVDSSAPLEEVPLGPGPGDTALFETSELEPGPYTVALTEGGGTLAEVGVTVVDPGAPVRLAVASRVYEEGEPIGLRWANAPGNRYDWLAVTPAGKGPGSYMAWRYIDASVQSDGSIDEASNGRWPLPSGRYQVQLCVDDSYKCLAATRPFVIAER